MSRFGTDVICIGSVHWDIIGRAAAPFHIGDDLPGRITRTPGGVAMNIATTLAWLGRRPAMLTAIGRDQDGDQLLAAATDLGLDCLHVYRDPDLATGVYMAIEGTNGMVAAVADAGSLELAGDSVLAPLSDGRLGSMAAPWPALIVIDGNLTEAQFAKIATSPAFAAADLRVAAASPAKALRLAPLLRNPRVTFYMNVEEAGRICGKRFGGSHEAVSELLARGVRRALVTDGAHSCSDGMDAGILMLTPHPVPAIRFTGAGDTFMAAHIAAELGGRDRSQALAFAIHAAADYISGKVLR